MTPTILKFLFVFILSVQYACAELVTDNVELSHKAVEIDPMSYGAKGDGITDDTESLQRAFNICSNKGLTCRISSGKNYLVTAPVFLWGKAHLKGEAGSGSITFNVQSSPYLLNIGISGRNQLEKPFSGVISDVKFKVIGGNGGRVIFIWRSNEASIRDNVFDVGGYAYSATSSGNDNKWVKNGFENTVRKNISITGNKIFAASTNIGSEGIGLVHFDGAMISGNTIIGVGDDPIGIHFCKNIKIKNNIMKSVDGRLFVANSKNVEIGHNKIYRMPSLKDNKFYKGISLLYIGFELLDTKNNFAAPTNIYIHDNYLYYPAGSIDAGAAIYLYGPRGVIVKNNQIINDSELVIATGIHLLPARFSADWDDPDNQDSLKVARVWGVTVSGNTMGGKFPQKLIMTGNCDEYIGKVLIKDNVAKGYQLYCPHVINANNKVHTGNI